MKTNRLLLFFLPSVICFNLSAQDIILNKSGDEIKAKVLEVNIDNIRYKAFENMNGPIYTILKAEIFMITYENGSKDIFKEVPVNQTQQNKSDLPEFLRKGLLLGFHVTPGAGGIYDRIDDNTVLKFGINLGADLSFYFNNYVGIKTGFTCLYLPSKYYFNSYNNFSSQYIVHIEDNISSIGVPFKFLLTTGKSVGFYLESGLNIYFPISSNLTHEHLALSIEGLWGINIKATERMNLNFGLSSHHSLTNYLATTSYNSKEIFIGFQMGMMFKLKK